MTMTIDIPDAVYQEPEQRAAVRQETLQELILERLVQSAAPLAEGKTDEVNFSFPAVESKNPGSLTFGPEGVYEYIPFP